MSERGSGKYGFWDKERVGYPSISPLLIGHAERESTIRCLKRLWSTFRIDLEKTKVVISAIRASQSASRGNV